MTMDVRAVAYTPGGERIGVLPDVLEMTLTVPVAATPTVALTYPAGDLGVRGTLLDSELEVAVEVTHDGLTWTEPDGARFLSLRAEENPLGDGTESRSLQAIHVSNRLSEARVWDVPPAAADSDGKWSFLSQNAGTILRTLWDAATRRGWGAGLTLDVTTTTDSAKRPWAKVVTLAYAPSVDLAAVVTSLVDLGLIDVSWSGRTMRVYNADGYLARRREQVTWPLSAGTTAAPEATTWADLCTDVLVIGEGGRTWRIHNDAAPAGLRRIEKVVEAGGVELEATARLVAAATLASGATPALEAKREWHADHALLLPWRDYRPGDWITVERTAGKEVLRVAQVSVTRDADGVTGHTTFGTRLDDALTRQAKRTRGITGGAATSGSGVRPAPEGQDRRVPAQVQGLVATAEAVPLADGTVQGLLLATWAPTTTATDSTAMEISSYEVAVRPDTVGAPWMIVSTVVSPTAQIPTYPPGTAMQTKVRARGTYATRPGVWSEAVTLTVPHPDRLHPPTAPTVSGDYGVLTLSWDGMLLDAARASAPPTWFSHVQAEEASAPGGPWTVVGTMMTGGPLVTLDRQEQIGSTLYYRLVAVDTVGRSSQPSEATKHQVRSQLAEDLEDARVRAQAATAASDERRREVEAVASRLGTLEGTVGGLGAALESARALADEARAGLSAASSAASEAQEAAAAAGRAASEKSAAAERAAKEYADAQAAAAKAAAVAAASGDAASKAAAAQAAAVAQAKKDATALAEAARKAAAEKAEAAAAQAEAAAGLARTADSKAAAAQAAADAADKKAASATSAVSRAQAAADAGQAAAAAADSKAAAAQAAAAAAQALANSALMELWPNRRFVPGGADMLGLDATEVPPVGAARLIRDRDYVGRLWHGFVPGHVLRVRVTARRLQGESGLRAGVDITGDGAGRRWIDAVETATRRQSPIADLGGGWGLYEGTLTIPDGSGWRGRVWISINQGLAGQPPLGTTQWLISDLTVTDVTETVATQAAADAAAEAALDAKRVADAASAKAMGAQASADKAQGVATSADKRYTTAPRAPRPADGDGRPDGAVWEDRTTPTATRRWVWSASAKAWTVLKAGSDFVGDKAIGRAQIGDAAVGTLQVADGSITNAKVGGLNVDKLTVTGGARMPVAVMNSVVGDEAFLRAVRAETILVAGGNMNPDPTWRQSWGPWERTMLDGGPVMYLAATGSQVGGYLQVPGVARDAVVTLEPGASYRVSISARGRRLVGSGGYLSVYLRTPLGTGGGVYVQRVLLTHVTEAWGTYAATYTYPARAPHGRVGLGVYLEREATSGGVWVRDLRIEKMAGSTLIEPGSVTSDHVVASESMASKLGQFLRVTTGMLKAGGAEFDAARVKGELTGNTITGAVVRSSSGPDRVQMDSHRLDVIKGGTTHVRLSPELPFGIGVKSPVSSSILPLSSIIFGAGSYTWTGTYSPDGQGYSRSTFTVDASPTGRAVFLSTLTYEMGTQSPSHRWGEIAVNGTRIYAYPTTYAEGGWDSGQLTLMTLAQGLPTSGKWTVRVSIWFGTSATSGFTRWSHRDISAIVIPA